MDKLPLTSLWNISFECSNWKKMSQNYCTPCTLLLIYVFAEALDCNTLPTTNNTKESLQNSNFDFAFTFQKTKIYFHTRSAFVIC